VGYLPQPKPTSFSYSPLPSEERNFWGEESLKKIKPSRLKSRTFKKAEIQNFHIRVLKSGELPRNPTAAAAAQNYSTQLLPHQESSAQQLRQNPPPVAAPYQ
jgi:hypothetical protein